MRWISAALFIAGWCTFGAPRIGASPGQTVPQIERLEVLVDPSGALTRDDVAKREDWVPDTSRPLNFQYSTATYWLRLHLDRKPTDDAFLVIGNPVLYHLTLHRPLADGGFEQETLGLFHPGDNRFGLRHRVFGLESTAPGPLYLRIRSVTPLQIPIAIRDAAALEAESREHMAVFPAIFAILLVFALYNFLIFLHVRRSEYFHYAAYGSCMACLFITTEGFLPEFVPYPLRALAIHVFSGVGFYNLIHFTRRILLTKRALPRLDKLLRGCGVIVLMIPIAGAIVDLTLWYIIGQIVSGVIVVTCFVAGVLSWRRRKVAKVYLAAFVCPLIGTVLFSAQIVGTIPTNFLTSHAMHIGFVVELVLFSQALAMLISQLNRRVVSKSRKLTALNLSLSREVVERTRIAKELEEQRAIVVHAAKMRALGAITASVAHEINTPLTVLKLSIERLRLITNRDEMPVKSHEELQKIEASSIRMILRISKVVRSLLNYARDSSNDAPKLVEPKQMIEDLMDICLAAMQRHGVQLEIGAVASEVQVSCRMSEITQILLNLVNNASDAIRGGTGSLIRIACVVEAGSVQFSVSDDGPGVPEEFLSKLMNVSFTTKKEGEGTGLGLGICKMLADRNGAALAYHRRDGMTQFVLSMPAAEAAVSDTA